jgi:hypothetical protein
MTSDDFLAQYRSITNALYPGALQSHWAAWDHIQQKGLTTAACGVRVEGRELSLTPTCPECHRRATMTADEMFGTDEVTA